MQDVAAVHYRRVVSSNDYDQVSRRKAMRRLGLKSFQGMLLTDDEIKQAKQSIKNFKVATQRWIPRLQEWQEAINAQSDKSARTVDDLLAVEDPQLTRVMQLFITESGEAFGEALVMKLGMTETQEATEGLVRFSVLSPWLKVRQTAIDELRARSMHDYVPLLLSGLASPIETEWSIVEQPDGSIAYEHIYFREGAEENYTFESDFVARPRTANGPRNLSERLGRNVDVRRTFRAAADRDREAAQINLVTALSNQTVFEALEQTTRAQVPREPNEWWQWWQDYNETDVQKANRYGYQYQERQMTRVSAAPVQTECFVAGTPIWTETGLERVEFIQVGDRVLAQDPESGELAFKPVMATTVRPPSDVVQMTFESEKITATLGHPMWVTGEGWRMAKFLLPGYQLRTVHGGTFVKDIERPDEPASAYNLVIADFHTYFVGDQGILVHDSMYRLPTRSVVPGLKLD